MASKPPGLSGQGASTGVSTAPTTESTTQNNGAAEFQGQLGYGGFQYNSGVNPYAFFPQNAGFGQADQHSDSEWANYLNQRGGPRAGGEEATYDPNSYLQNNYSSILSQFSAQAQAAAQHAAQQQFLQQYATGDQSGLFQTPDISHLGFGQFVDPQQFSHLFSGAIQQQQQQQAQDAKAKAGTKDPTTADEAAQAFSQASQMYAAAFSQLGLGTGSDASNQALVNRLSGLNLNPNILAQLAAGAQQTQQQPQQQAQLTSNSTPEKKSATTETTTSAPASGGPKSYAAALVSARPPATFAQLASKAPATTAPTTSAAPKKTAAPSKAGAKSAAPGPKKASSSSSGSGKTETKRPNTASSTAPARTPQVRKPLPTSLKDRNVNPEKFDTSPTNARYFVIKSYSADDVHKSIKYNVWASTKHGNKRLDQAFKEAKGAPIYLFFSVNGSGCFCGMAKMESIVDYTKSFGAWALDDKWTGQFQVKWIFIKNVPNKRLRHIRLANNQNKPVTNSRDTQEVPAEQGKQTLKIVHTFEHNASILDDFDYFDKAEQTKVKAGEKKAGSVLNAEGKKEAAKAGSAPASNGKAQAPADEEEEEEDVEEEEEVGDAAAAEDDETE